MKFLEILYKDKVYKIRRKTIIHVLKCISGNDYSDSDDVSLIKTMKKYKLFDETTLNSMVNYRFN